MSNTTLAHQRALSNERTELNREIGLFGGVSVLGGIMIGSGIFFLGSIVLQRSDMNISLALWVWILGGLVTLLSGICYAELGAMMPKAGGVYVYLREAYGERLAFVCGFANFLIGNSASIAALALAFAGVIATVVPMDPMNRKLLAVGVVGLLTYLQIRGIRTGSFVQNLFMILKMLPILAILIWGLATGTESPSFVDFHMTHEFSLTGFLSMVGFGVIATLWAYEGWTNLNVISEEVRNPKRNIPLAIILSIVGVMVLYVLFNYAIYRVLPFETIQSAIEGKNLYLGTEAAKVLFGPAGQMLVTAAMGLAIFSSLNGCVMVFPRMYYAMSRDGAFFSSLAKLHPVHKTPVNAILASSSIGAALIFVRDLDQLTSLVAVCGLIFHGMAFYGVIVLRRRYPSMERPYKVWFYPFTVYLACAIMVALIMATIMHDPTSALLNIAIPIVGLGVYQIGFAKRYERVHAEQIEEEVEAMTHRD